LMKNESSDRWEERKLIKFERMPPGCTEYGRNNTVKILAKLVVLFKIKSRSERAHEVSVCVGTACIRKQFILLKQ
jgi:hypothetical protein